MPLPSLPPADASFGVHWLAVEGKVPAVPENVPPALSPLAEDDQESREQVAAASKERGAQLSKELQQYFENVKLAVFGSDSGLKRKSLASLSTDAGIQPLTPHLVSFVQDTVQKNMRGNLSALWGAMQMTRALLTNPHLKVEPLLHIFMPSLISCLVGKPLCATPVEDHWALRDFSAALLAFVMKRFGQEYVSLQPRVTRTLMKALDDHERGLPSHYGAVVGLARLGDNAVRTLLVPNLRRFLSFLDAEYTAHSADVLMCRGAFMEAVGNFVSHQFQDLPYILHEEEPDDWPVEQPQGALVPAPAVSAARRTRSGSVSSGDGAPPTKRRRTSHSTAIATSHYTAARVAAAVVAVPDLVGEEGMQEGTKMGRLPIRLPRRVLAEITETFADSLLPFYVSSSSEVFSYFL